MRTAIFSTKPYDQKFISAANEKYNHELVFFEVVLNPTTAALAKGFPCICAFVNDCIDSETLLVLSKGGTKLLALRCAGFNNVNLKIADELGITVVNVPAYSPYAVAEHTVAMMLSLNRKIYRGYARVRENNFALDGLLGFDMNGKTVGIIGTGRIGMITGTILTGFGCPILAFDRYKNPECEKRGFVYTSLDELFSCSDIISLHCPLTKETHHLINSEALSQMKTGVMIINTSRGGLINTKAVIKGLKSGKVGYLGLDVYEEETDLFFEDLSSKVLQDDVFARLLTFPNVLITAHQAFFTKTALNNIAHTTLSNILEFEKTGQCKNTVRVENG